MNKKTRLEINDTIMSSLMKMCEEENGGGFNPGCMTFLMEMLKKKDWKVGGENMGFMQMLSLDTIGLYGSKAYMLWNACCDRDLSKVELVLRNWQMGKLSEAKIHENLSFGRGTPFEGLVPLEELFPREFAKV